MHKELSSYIYFDFNATSIPDQRLTTNDNIKNFPLNPSAIHAFGREAKSIIENSRSKILKSINAEKSFNLTFFSSGTEANNTIIRSFANKKVLCSKAEHFSVLNTVETLPNYELIDVDSFGRINIKHLEQVLSTSNGSFVSVIYANNETGVINDIKEISNICRKYDTLLHIDAVQAYGKILFNADELGADFITISPHKIGGMQGAAGLLARKSNSFSALMYGGGQEKGKRPGTENVLSIDNFGKIAEILDIKINEFSQCKKLIDHVENEISKISSEAIIINQKIERLPNTSVISMKGASNELQLIQFDLKKFALSSGSACSSGKVTTSHVLLAMGIDEEKAKSTIRISIGPNNNLSEMNKFIEAWKEIYTKLNVKVRNTNE